MNHTALYDVHRGMGAKMIEFSGWMMPLEYIGTRDEHLAVRNSVGLFDISHMGEIEVYGKEASLLCQLVTTNDISKLNNLQAQYTLLCNPEGGIIDDIIVYKISDEHFFICVNAVNTLKDYEWINSEESKFKAIVVNKSPEYSQIALQGPNSQIVLSSVLKMDFSRLKRFFFQFVKWKDSNLIVARTGYTGEDGFEIFLPWDLAKEIWGEIIENAQSYGIQPCGLGARDTLRIEMGYPLYGHEIEEDKNPFEAGLGSFVKFDKGGFIGKESLLGVIEKGIKKKLYGFEMLERGIPRRGYGIVKGDILLGAVTSGTLSPSLEKPIGMGYLKTDIYFDDEIEIEIRGTNRKAKIVSLPFYKRQGKYPATKAPRRKEEYEF
ncbi:MAG TPA: glycine cleavage system aminomethyltransferase GcvT [Thermodesulfobacteriota bacterium]|nr:glycine cleavage system aminomethyltransferase GcvT [Thermodesulfobacteriota bacterium]